MYDGTAKIDEKLQSTHMKVLSTFALSHVFLFLFHFYFIMFLMLQKLVPKKKSRRLKCKTTKTNQKRESRRLSMI